MMRPQAYARAVVAVGTAMSAAMLLVACGGGRADDRDSSRPTVTYTTSTAPATTGVTVANGEGAEPSTSPATVDGSEETFARNNDTAQGADHVNETELERADPFPVWRAAMLGNDIVAIRDQIGTELDVATAAALAQLSTRYFEAAANGTGREAFPEQWFYGVSTTRYRQRVRVAAATTWPAAPQFARVLHFYVEDDPAAKTPVTRAAVLWWTTDARGAWVPADPSTVPLATWDGNEPVS